MWVVASLTQSRTCLPSRRSGLRRGPRGKAAAAAAPERSLRSSPTPAAAFPACQTSGRRAACNPRLLLGAGSGFPSCFFLLGDFLSSPPGFSLLAAAAPGGTVGKAGYRTAGSAGRLLLSWDPGRERGSRLGRGSGRAVRCPEVTGIPTVTDLLRPGEPAPATSPHEQDEAGPRNYFGRATSWL